MKSRPRGLDLRSGAVYGVRRKHCSCSPELRRRGPGARRSSGKRPGRSGSPDPALPRPDLAGDAARRRQPVGGRRPERGGGGAPATQAAVARRRGRRSGARRRGVARSDEEAGSPRARAGRRDRGDVGARPGHVARRRWLRRAAGWSGRCPARAGHVRRRRRKEICFSFFFRVSGRGRDPKTEGCIYRHRGS